MSVADESFYYLCKSCKKKIEFELYPQVDTAIFYTDGYTNAPNSFRGICLEKCECGHLELRDNFNSFSKYLPVTDDASFIKGSIDKSYFSLEETTTTKASGLEHLMFLEINKPKDIMRESELRISMIISFNNQRRNSKDETPYSDLEISNIKSTLEILDNKEFLDGNEYFNETLIFIAELFRYLGKIRRLYKITKSSSTS